MIANDALFERIQQKCDSHVWMPDEARYRTRVIQHYAPATEEQLLATEEALGFPLPSMLRMLYGCVANGGFGPGFGILGAIGGFSSTGLGGNIVEAYRIFTDGVPLIDYYQYKNESSMQTTFTLPNSVWSADLLPICDWGCLVTSFLDVKSDHVLRGGPISRTHYALREQATSLEEWLEHWLQDE